MSEQLTEEQRRGLDQVEKMLRVAGSSKNEEEAAAFTMKAMARLAELNLTMASVDETGEGLGRRAEEKLSGGFYEYERDLWERIADLNFCFCFHRKVWVKRTRMDAKADRIQDEWRRRNILRGEFKIIGRVVNISATRGMADYLLGTIERLTRERLQERLGMESVNSQMRSHWATSYREGIAERISEKLWDRRQQQISEEAAAREAAERLARERGMQSGTTETAVTLYSLKKSEEDANTDFMYGEGTSARWAADRADRARRAREAHDAYVAWAADNPEEARKQEAERVTKERKRSQRSRAEPRGKARDWSAYRAGYERGDSVGIDQQADTSTGGRGIGHTRGALGHG